MRTGLAEDAAPRTVNTATATVTKAAAPESRVSIAAPDLGAPVQAVTTPELGSAIAIPNLANAGMAVEAPARHIAPQAVTATTSSSGSSLAMEHIEAAKRKGVAASDISYTAASAFESAGAYAPPAIETGPAIDWQQTAMAAASKPFFESLPITGTAPTVDVPDIDSEARARFAEAMPPQRQTVIANAEREGSANETPRQNVFHIANMNFNADELQTLLDFVRQLEMAVTEPEEATV
jgi:hypothetical protein